MNCSIEEMQFVNRVYSNCQALSPKILLQTIQRMQIDESSVKFSDFMRKIHDNKSLREDLKVGKFEKNHSQNIMHRLLDLQKRDLLNLTDVNCKNAFTKITLKGEQILGSFSDESGHFPN